MKTIISKAIARAGGMMRGITIIILFFTIASFSNLAYASNVLVSRNNGFIKAYEKRNIRHQKSRQNSILVSKPVLLDTQIFNLISREDIRSIEDYSEWIQENIRYERDGSDDIWLAPEKTLAGKHGDCEDFAFLNAAVLHFLGYEPIVMAMAGGTNSSGHAICVFKKDDFYAWFENGAVKESLIASAKDFYDYLLRDYGYERIYEIDLGSAGEHVLSGK